LPLRYTVALVMLLSIGVCDAGAEEWSSRHGDCYDWEGHWDVREQMPGLWVGYADFVHVGGRCGRGTQRTLTYEVRAGMVGEDVFVYRTAGPSQCYMHGKRRPEGVTGFELCSGFAASVPFALRLSPSGRDPDR
jgi:hypothetical protein